MRWSLILSTSLTVLSTFSAALVIPSTESLVDLERRGNGAKASSKAYRKNSEAHNYAYKFDQTGGVSRERLSKADRPANGKAMIMIPKTDAGRSYRFEYIRISEPLSLTTFSFSFFFFFSIVDHVFEHQMLNSHLAKHNLKYEYVFYFDGIIFAMALILYIKN
jgi:hypothetical protein